mgnify:CR=1 FL=1|tara:strand:- start:22 stop:807 length:786 start_codon:yes stop_codon:yes gene_type:complete
MFLLLTTSILNDAAIANLHRLNASLLTQNFPIYHVILTQNPDSYQPPILEEADNYTIDYISSDTMMSLSSARNIMLKHCLDNGIFEKVSYVAFPDDDCWYTEDFLLTISSELANSGFVFTKYSSIPQKLVETDYKEAGYRDVVRQASSNTIFIAKEIVMEVGLFDERLGVGAEFNGGEDLDFALRAYVLTRKASFLDKHCVGHRDKIDDLKAKYFQGSYIALGKQKFKAFGIFFQFLRKLMIGIYLIVFSTLTFKKLLVVK